MSKNYVNVALNLPLDSLYTYGVPDYLTESVESGKRVLVNFGNRAVTGIVVEVTDFTILKRVKEIKSVLDEKPIITAELMDFCKWISEYYLAPMGEVLFSAVPRKSGIKSDKYYFLSADYRDKLDQAILEDEILIDIIKILEKNSHTGFTKKQIEKKLKFNDLTKFINILTNSSLITCENYYSKPTGPKLSKIVSNNFNSIDTSLLIKEHRLKSPKQIQLLNRLAGGEDLELNQLCKELNISTSTVNSFLKKGLIEIREVRSYREPHEIFSEDVKEIDLNNDQLTALKALSDSMKLNVFRTFLLYGITGSGKTEVYINSIREVIESGKTAIVLVPEISLTPQLIYRFRNVFGNMVGMIHSKLSDGERLDTFDRIINGSIKIVIGARSALFAPLSNLGMIIVDEEHDSSYKQENSPRYNGRDAAIYRAKLNNAVVILGSATPSIESFHNAETGKYELIMLNSRVLNTKLPEIKIVDLLKREKQEFDEEQKDFFDRIDRVRIRFLSKELIYEIGERLAKKESVIILQNRRGFHSYMECLNCGNVEMCVRCNVSLTYHKAFDLMKCHYCGYSRKFIKICTACKSTMVIPKGAGTERVEEELQKIFPAAVIKRMDSDTLTSRRLYQQILKDFYDKKIDILTGTQIISKGLDFPDVTLVGVVNADIGLLNPDFRATERTFQILTQVAGRSGRSENKGEVLIQTNHSDYYVFADVKNHDYKNFYEKELKIRKQLNYPPFSRIAIIEANSEDKMLAESKIKELFNLSKQSDTLNKLEILPPIQPLFSKLKDRFRYHLIIKAGKDKDSSGKYLTGVLKGLKDYSKNFPGKVRIIIDVDAVNLL